MLTPTEARFALPCVRLIRMSALTDRIEELMEATGWDVQQVAAIAEVTPSAVRQWLGRGSKEIKSIALEAAVLLGERSGFRPLWISKGKGPKFPNVFDVSARVVADSRLLPSNVAQLDPDSTIARVVELMRETDARGRWRCHDAVVDALRAYEAEQTRAPKASGE